jgi:hypothetical protein
MAIVQSTQYSGQKSVSTLTGYLRLEEGNGRMVLFDGTVNRMVIGLYKGRVIIAISKPGEDVFAALDA